MSIQTLIFTLIPATLLLSLMFGTGFCKLMSFFKKPKEINLSVTNNEQNLSKGAGVVELNSEENSSLDSNNQVEKKSVYNKIIERAEAEALEIKEKGREKAEQITAQVIEDTKEKISKLLQDAEEKNDDLVKTKTAEFEQTSKQKVLSKQKEIVKNTFNIALEKLLSLDDEALKNLVVSYMKKVNIDADINILVNKVDHIKYQRLFSSKNDSDLDILSKLLGNKDYHITLSSEEAHIKGGFIVIGKYYDVDYSYEAILDNLEEELITEVSKMLFKSEE